MEICIPDNAFRPSPVCAVGRVLLPEDSIPHGNFPLKSSLPAEFSTWFCLHLDHGGMLVFLGPKEGYPENILVLRKSQSWRLKEPARVFPASLASG